MGTNELHPHFVVMYTCALSMYDHLGLPIVTKITHSPQTKYHILQSHTHTHTHTYIYIHVYIISYFEYANLRSITTFSIVEYGTYPNVEQLLYFPAISITCPKRVIRCHMPKATNLDHPNWLLPSHLIELKLVAWAHGQTI